MSTEGWPGSPQPPPPAPEPRLRRTVGQLLDHTFDLLPTLLLFALAFGPKRLEFAAFLT